MKVGVLGSGEVGQALGRGFASRNHEVMLGTRSPQSEKVQAWVAEGEGHSSGTFADAAAFGELIVLATLGLAAEEALELAGPDELAGKVVIDVTNPLEYAVDGSVRLAFGSTTRSASGFSARFARRRSSRPSTRSVTRTWSIPTSPAARRPC